MTDCKRVRPGFFPVWNFEIPNTKKEAEKEYQRILNLLRDIEEHPEKYKINSVVLAVEPKKLWDLRCEVCLLQYHAFKGYVLDTMNAFIDRMSLLDEGENDAK